MRMDLALGLAGKVAVVTGAAGDIGGDRRTACLASRQVAMTEVL